MIYAVEILGSMYVKIGFSSNESPSSRVATLQTGCPFEIVELFCVEGTLRQEQSLHAALRVAFGRIRIPIPPNEWYPGKNPFFQGFLERLKHGFDFGHTYLTTYSPAMKQGSKRQGRESTDPNIKWPFPKKLSE